MAELLATPAFWGSLATLTFLEIVLGIDNLLFISIATGKLEEKQRERAQRIGIWGAMALRILMLGLIFWILQADRSPLFHIPHEIAMFMGGGDEQAVLHI
jgi:predicted tellurium resistance membrane protein TerC